MFLACLLRLVFYMHEDMPITIIVMIIISLISYLLGKSYIKTDSFNLNRYPILLVLPAACVLWTFLLPKTNVDRAIPAIVIIAYISGNRLRDLYPRDPV